MNVRVEPNRFLSVVCEPDERIVFDRKETKYHLLRDSAARLWDDICDGGTFEVSANPSEEQDPVALLAEAGLIGIDEAVSSEGITRRVWLRRTGKVSAAAVVLPLVASITTPRLALGQTPGPSLEDEVVDQIGETNSSGLLDESPIVESRRERLTKDERNQLKDETGNNGTRTRPRNRTGQESTSGTGETEIRTRTRNRDR
jgi:hypothetical protein